MDVQLGFPAFAAVVAAAGAQSVVTVRGDVDVFTAPVLREALTQAGGEGVVAHRRVVVDLSGVTFLDATGLGVLVGAAGRAQRCGSEIVLRHPSRMTLRVLEIAELLSAFQIERRADCREVRPPVDAVAAYDVA